MTRSSITPDTLDDSTQLGLAGLPDTTTAQSKVKLSPGLMLSSTILKFAMANWGCRC